MQSSKKIARRDKRAFLSDQCKEIEENNRMGKTRDLKKIQRYQGNISCKDGHNIGQTLCGIESENIKKRLQEYTEKLYHKDLCDPGLGREFEVWFCLSSFLEGALEVNGIYIWKEGTGTSQWQVNGCGLKSIGNNLEWDNSFCRRQFCDPLGVNILGRWKKKND